MTRLIETRDGTLRPLLAGGDLDAAYRALEREIATQLSPAHAALLSRPVRTGATTSWIAEGQATCYSDLPAESRRALERAVGAILSDIRRLAESGTAPHVRAAWPALAEVPDLGHVFAVDGRPALAAWGHAGMSGRLLSWDDGVPFQPKPKLPWLAYAALAGLAVLAGTLLPRAAPWLIAAPAACVIPPGQLQALDAQLKEDARGEELRTLLATLTDEVGRQQLLCPLPSAAAPPPPAPPPPPTPAPPPPPSPPPPPPPPRAALPQDGWANRDLSLLDGCWHLVTSLTASQNDEPSRRTPVQSWQMCFDRAGRGHQTIRLGDGRQCVGPLSAAFQGDRLVVNEPGACEGQGLTMNRSNRICRRQNDHQAICSGTMLVGPAAGMTYAGLFKR